MASSLASIAETWPENVLPQWQQKNAYAKNKARPNNKTLGPDGIFCTKCNFLQVLDLLIFQQKQPGHWAEVVCHFHLLYILFYLVFVFDIRNVRCKVTKSKFGTVRICRFLSAFVSFCQFSEQCFFSLQSYEKENWHCQSMSVCVSLCHFVSLSDLLSLSRCKDTKRKFGTVTFCHYLSPFVTFQQIAISRCKVTKKDFGTVRICPHMSGNVRFCPHFLFRCKVTQKKIGTVQLCPFVSIYVQLRHSNVS